MTNKLKLIIALIFACCSNAFAQNINVTFQVASPDSTPVHVQGSWNWGSYPGAAMTLIAPGKYSVTLSLASNTTHEFKFNNGNTTTFENLVPGMPCTITSGAFTNRILTVGSTDTAVCYTWATCNTCVVTPPPPPPTPVNVTFQVESPDSTPVHVQGSWNWRSFPGAAMTLVSGTKYTTTLQLMPNSPYEFKFNNGVGPTFENLTPGMPCTATAFGYTNRTLALGANDTTLCFTWGTCTTCPVVPPPSPINVKFAVQSPDSLPVHVFGNWNNWSNFPGAPMTLNTTTGNYEATVSLTKGATIEYLFVSGTAKEVLDSAWACTNNNAQYTNRKTTLGQADTTLCNRWKSCELCTPVSVEEIANSSVSVVLNNNFIKLNSTAVNSIQGLEIFDIVGKQIYSSNGKVNTNQNIPVSLHNNTIYIVRIKEGNTYYAIKSILK